MSAPATDAVASAAGLNPEALAQLHATARAAAESGAAVLMDHYGHLTNIRSKGRQGDLVTEADEAAEQAVLSLLRDQTPSIGILAEESGSIGPDVGLQWMEPPTSLTAIRFLLHRSACVGTVAPCLARSQFLTCSSCITAVPVLAPSATTTRLRCRGVMSSKTPCW